MATICSRPVKGKDFSVYLSKQANCGVVNPNPVFDQVRRVSGKPEIAPTYTTSNEVTLNRQPRDQVLDNIDFNAALEFEVSQWMVKYLEEPLFGAFSGLTNIAGDATIAFDSVGNQVTTSTGGLFANVLPGSFIFIEGSPANSGSLYVASKPDDETLNITAGQIVADEPEGAAITLKQNTLRNADVYNLLTVQKRTATTTTPIYQTFIDSVTDGLTLTIGRSGIMTAAFNALIPTLLPGQTEVTGQTDNATPTDKVVSNVSGLDSFIYVDYEKVNADVAEMTIELSNESAATQQAGKLGAAVIAEGDAPTITGSISTIQFRDDPLEEENKLIAGTRFALTVPIQFNDSAGAPSGNFMYVTLHEVLYTEGSQPDAFGDLAEFQGSYACETDPTLGFAMSIDLNFDPLI